MAELRRRPPDAMLYDFVGLEEEDVWVLFHALSNSPDASIRGGYLWNIVRREIERLDAEHAAQR